MSTFRFITALSKHLPVSFLALLLCSAISPLHAQLERPFRQFATQKAHKRLLGENAGYSASLADIETHIKDFGVAGMSHIDTIPVIVKTNGDMKDFMAFRIQTEQQTTPNKAA